MPQEHIMYERDIVSSSWLPCTTATRYVPVVAAVAPAPAAPPDQDTHHHHWYHVYGCPHLRIICRGASALLDTQIATELNFPIARKNGTAKKSSREKRIFYRTKRIHRRRGRALWLFSGLWVCLCASGTIIKFRPLESMSP